MITVQNNASVIILLSIRYYESIMNSQLGTKDCIMKESKIIVSSLTKRGCVSLRLWFHPSSYSNWMNLEAIYNQREKRIP